MISQVFLLENFSQCVTVGIENEKEIEMKK